MSYRDEVNWQALINEGMKVHNLHPKVPEASVLIAQVDEHQNVVVVLVPCSKGGTDRIRELVLGFSGMVRMMLASVGAVRGW